MSGDQTSGVRRRRGRLLVLVDNGVHGDSRVQKTARSAAEAGWQVTLLGKSPDTQEHTWRLGEAEVRLIPVSSALARRRHEFRRAPLRRPLAYRPGPLAAYRQQHGGAGRGGGFPANAALRVGGGAG